MLKFILIMVMLSRFFPIFSSLLIEITSLVTVIWLIRTIFNYGSGRRSRNKKYY